MDQKDHYQQAINEALARRWSAITASSSWARTSPVVAAPPARWMPGAGYWVSPKGCDAEFGPTACLDTPISRIRVIGAAAGAAAAGLRPVAELMFVDFIGVCFDQIFNQGAKFRYMFGGRRAHRWSSAR